MAKWVCSSAALNGKKSFIAKKWVWQDDPIASFSDAIQNETEANRNVYLLTTKKDFLILIQHLWTAWHCMAKWSTALGGKKSFIEKKLSATRWSNCEFQRFSDAIQNETEAKRNVYFLITKKEL